jgi:hypothetical protein
MVAPPSCSGLKVEILVDSQPLQEYDDVDAGPLTPNTTTKYIEAQSNAYFATRVTFNYDFLFPADDLPVKTTLDQQHTTIAAISSRDLFNPLGGIIEGPRARIGHETNAMHKFSFVSLDLDKFLVGFHPAYADLRRE